MHGARVCFSSLGGFRVDEDGTVALLRRFGLVVSDAADAPDAAEDDAPARALPPAASAAAAHGAGSAATGAVLPAPLRAVRLKALDEAVASAQERWQRAALEKSAV